MATLNDIRSMKACDDIEKSRAWIQGCFDRDNCWNFVMELLPTSDAPADTETSRVIGLMGAVRAPEIGYMLLPVYWGRGYTTEALNAFLDLFFEHFSRGENPTYEYAEALTDSEHVVSQHILTKAGFVLLERRENDFENPTLGLRSTFVYRKYRPGSSVGIEGKDT